MKTRHLLISSVLGLGLALGLMWVLAVRSVPSVAAPPVAPIRNASGVGSESIVAEPVSAPGAPVAELTVCATCPYTSVQAAVDEATDRDIIKVAAGLYTGVQARGGVTQVVYINKTVTIRGGYTTSFTEPPDPEANPTVLDAQGQGRVFYITGDVSPTIEGLLITGGNAAGMGGGFGGWNAGGGLYVARAAATIINNQVFNNAAYGGGGVYLHRSPATLSDNTISSNTTSDNGGGVYLFESEATLSANVITSNFAGDSGGGVCLHASDAVLSANEIVSNMANSEGGGLYLWDSSPTLSANMILDNSAMLGGGLYLWDSSPTLSANTILGNSAVLVGGGLFVRESSAELDANIVAENQAANSGSGLYIAGSSLRSQHTTIARNTNGDSSGIYVTSHNSSHSMVVLTNTILVSQTTGIMVTAGNTVTLEATLWGDGDWANADDWAGMGTIFTGTVNIYGDPAFAGTGDYHLTEGSAARDEGVETNVGPDVDLDLRPIGAGFDIGADEFPVIVTATQDVSTTLVYTDPQDNLTELEIPAGAVTETVVIIYTPKHPQAGPALPEGMVWGPHVFDLDVYRDDVLVPHYAFQRAITLTSEYAQTDVQDMIEQTLALYRWTEDAWQKIGEQEGETQTRDVDNNVLTVHLISNSRFGEMGSKKNGHLFLPLIFGGG